MDWKLLTKNKWLLFLAAIGILLLLVGSFWPTKQVKSANAAASVFSDSQNTTSSSVGSGGNLATAASGGQFSTAEQIESYYDQSLQHILSQIAGIHAVSVMVTVDSSNTLQIAKNDSSSKTVSGSGASGSTTTSKQDQVYSSQTGGGSPYILSSTQPSVRGVLVTVNADDFVVAKSEIIESITNVLDVPAYKISVEPQK